MRDWGEGNEGRYLVSYYGSGGGSCVGCYYDAADEDAADDCGAGACGFGEGDAAGVEGGVAVVVGEVEAGHGDGGDDDGGGGSG